MTTSKTNRLSTFAIIMLVVAMPAFTPTAQACAATGNMSEISTPNKSVISLVGQLDCMLSSHNPTTRQQAMQDIITLASNPHHHPSYVGWSSRGESLKASDFRALVPALLAIYGSRSDVSTRTLAAVALHAVGDEAGMEQLWTLADKERSPVLQNRVNGLLGDYFVNAYPELKGDRSITKSKVKRAQRRAAAERLLVEAH